MAEPGKIGGELVEVAFVRDSIEGEMIRGVLEAAGIPSMLQQVGFDGAQLGLGPLPTHGGAQKVLVHAEREEEARALIAATLAEGEDEANAEIPEPVNATYLEGAKKGRGPRDYGVVGAYTRIYLVSFGVMAAIFAVWLLSRALG